MAPLGSFRLKMNRYRGLEHVFVGVGARPDPAWVRREAIEVVTVPRPRFREMLADGRCEQLGALGVLALGRLEWGLDLLEDPLDLIERVVLSHIPDRS
ncbi:MAG: hypothetical protein K9G59_18770 [Caulobacter sp.]|nr:hypothetical protein [Caulobacter sp.]